MNPVTGTVDDTLPLGPPDRLDAFDPIGLDDVDATSLQLRRDNKYLLDDATGHELLAALAEGGRHRILTIDGRRRFRYRSIYFDTDDLELYRAAVQRRRHRAKVRIRQYVDTGGRFLEVKVRDRRGTQRKHRMSIEGATSTTLDVDMRRFVDTVVDEPAFARRLRPTAITSYRRFTLHDRNGATRATIDTDLTVFDVRPRPDDVPAPAVALGGVIIESKSELGVADLDHELWGRGIRPSRFSKYCTGLAALDDSLPSNRWHRVLQQHLTGV